MGAVRRILRDELAAGGGRQGAAAIGGGPQIEAPQLEPLLLANEGDTCRGCGEAWTQCLLRSWNPGQLSAQCEQPQGAAVAGVVCQDQAATIRSPCHPPGVALEGGQQAWSVFGQVRYIDGVDSLASRANERELVAVRGESRDAGIGTVGRVLQHSF